ncbi:MAG: protein arginine kinase [Bacillota bacterium]|nr:MAG: protein arginine kinase [Bacillota bacterium]
MESPGPESDTVISSRVRLARNLEGIPFPHLMTDEQADQVIDMVGAAFRSPAAGKLVLNTWQLIRMAELSPLDRHILVEKHLISPNLARTDRGAVVVGAGEAVSIMINEEDHLRIQCLYPGLQLAEALELANKVDDLLESRLEYAFHEKRGFATACPTNAGTGMRASVMVHLPVLVINNQAGRVLSTVVKLGFLVRGLYGEGTEALGNIFQVSNQVTLGQAEEEIVQNLRSVVLQVIGQERQLRRAIVADMREQIEDKVGRAYGTLLWGHIISSQEAMQLMSDVRLGIELGLIKGVDRKILNELLVAIRPAFLQKLAGRELDATERDVRRADLIRLRLKASGLERTE